MFASILAAVLAVQLLILSVTTVQVLMSLGIPVVIGLVTKLSASAWYKVPLAMLLTAIVTLISSNIADNGTAVFSQQTLVQFVITFLIQLGSFFGVIKPLKVRENLLAPAIGLG